MAERQWPPASEYAFLAGPYCWPKGCKIGDILHDEAFGDVRVDGFTQAPLAWPAHMHQRGLFDGLLPILFDGLVRAVCEEAELAVMHYWGVSRYFVNLWKQAIAGVEESDAVYVNLVLKCQDPVFRQKFGYK